MALLIKQQLNTIITAFVITSKMNKENSFFQNQPSTDIHDSKSTNSYSSRFLMLKNQKRSQVKQSKLNSINNRILPSKFQKAAITIQRFWRFKQHMNRKVTQKIFNLVQSEIESINLENNALQKIIDSYEKNIEIKTVIKQIQLKKLVQQEERQVSDIKKQCVITTFKLNKKMPLKRELQSIINEKQQMRLRNFELNRENVLASQTIEDLKKQEQIYLRQIKQLNLAHLKCVQKRNQVNQSKNQNLLQTSKFGPKLPELSSKD